MALTIGQVAGRAGVNIQTIRYYERRGLFPAPIRSPSGYRQYADDAVQRLRFIRHAKDLGFSLTEIRELLGLRVQRGAACVTVERSARTKLTMVEDRIRSLTRIRRTLERLVQSCQARRPTGVCPMLDAMEDDRYHQPARRTAAR